MKIWSVRLMKFDIGLRGLYNAHVIYVISQYWV